MKRLLDEVKISAMSENQKRGICNAYFPHGEIDKDKLTIKQRIKYRLIQNIRFRQYEKERLESEFNAFRELHFVKWFQLSLLAHRRGKLRIGNPEKDLAKKYNLYE